MLACVIQIDGWDPVANAAVALYAASHDDPRLCHLNGATWYPTIAKLPTLRYDLFDGDFSGQIVAPTTSLSLVTEPWVNFDRYSLADARFRLWTGELGDAWSGFTLRFDGRLSAQPKVKDFRAELAITVDDRWLDTALLATYAGTTGAEAPAAMKGEAKPFAIGAPRYVAGKLIDPVNSVFQVHNGAVHGFEAALERLARYGAAAANYASYAALVAATIAPGTWATANAVGMARFGAPPAGQISFLLQGDEGGAQGWVRTPGKVIRRLALLSSGAGKIDDAALDALDTARPYNISVYLDEQTTARDLIQRIAASLNCVAGVSWLGKLFVLPVGIGTPGLTLTADGTALPPVASVEQLDIAAPFKSIAIQAERTWQVHALSDIAFTATLIDVGVYSASATYREGNLVTLADGSRYLYTATTPSSGNAPPNTTYWASFAASTRNTIYRSSTDPASVFAVNDGDFWVDTGVSPIVQRVRISAAWQAAANNVTQGDQIGVANGATKNIITRSGTAPTSPVDGDVWVDTSVTPNVTKVRVSAAWQLGANLVTQGTDIGVQNGADVTANNQVVIEISPNPRFVPADKDAVVAASQFPIVFTPKVTRGGVDIRADAGTSYAITTSGCTASVDTSGSSKGSVSVSALSANTATVALTVTVGGIAQPPVVVQIKKDVAAPPSSSVGGGGGSSVKTASDSSIDPISGTTFTAISDVMTVTLASGESLYGVASLDYSVAGTGFQSRTASAKWRYASAGATPTNDFAAAITGSTATSGGSVSGEYTPPESGHGDFNQTVGGLSAGSYAVQLFAALNTTGRAVNFSGTASIEAKI